MHFLILKISFPSVYVTAVYEEASRTDVTVTLSCDPWLNELSYDLGCSTMENSWTACKSKSSFINCKAELSATISLKPACVYLVVSVGNMLIISNFNETIQFLKAVFKALAWKPRPVFISCVRRAFRHVITKKTTLAEQWPHIK